MGREVIRELLSRGGTARALVHRRGLDFPADQVQQVRADLFDSAALAREMAGCDAVIHLVGIIREKPRAGVTFERLHVEATRSVLEAARQAGVTRYVHMSAIGARADAASAYHRTKWMAEEAVRSSSLRWTILLPSLILGPDGEFVRMASQWAKRGPLPVIPLPFMPYFGRGLLGRGGAGKVQPVRAHDIARAFVDAIGNDKSVGQTYEIGGPEVMTWPEMYRRIAIAAAGKVRPTLAIPAWYARALTRIIPAALLPFNRDQVIMSQEDGVADLTKFEADFGWRPRSI